MRESINFWLHDVQVRTPIERRQAPLIQLVVLGLLLLSVLTLPLAIASTSGTAATKPLSVTSMVVTMLVYVASLLLLRRGHYNFAVMLISLALVASVGVLLVPEGLSSSWVLFFLLCYPIAFAGLLAGRYALWCTSGLSIALVGGLGLLSPYMSQVALAPQHNVGEEVLSFALLVIFLSLGLDRFGSSLRGALTLALRREQELEQIRAAQERIIAERTAALEAALIEVQRREACVVSTLNELQTSRDIIRELSAPVMPVLPGVLVAPLIGALDSTRAATLTENVLRAFERQRGRYIIFDITGVPVVDTQVAQVLIQTANALRLLGGQVLLVGIRPEVAQTIVSLGVDLGNIKTYGDLQEATAVLLRSQDKAALCA